MLKHFSFVATCFRGEYFLTGDIGRLLCQLKQHVSKWHLKPRHTVCAIIMFLSCNCMQCSTEVILNSIQHCPLCLLKWKNSEGVTLQYGFQVLMLRAVFLIELLIHKVSKHLLTLDVFTCCLWCYFYVQISFNLSVISFKILHVFCLFYICATKKHPCSGLFVICWKYVKKWVIIW
jgi:hypothetical protein